MRSADQLGVWEVPMRTAYNWIISITLTDWDD